MNLINEPINERKGCQRIEDDGNSTIKMAPFKFQLHHSSIQMTLIKNEDGDQSVLIVKCIDTK